jgi:hypothetical protein
MMTSKYHQVSPLGLLDFPPNLTGKSEDESERMEGQPLGKLIGCVAI